MTVIRTLYTWLEVENSASMDDIKKAYRELAKLHHPDKGGEMEKFTKINEAYEILSDDEKRKAYDKKVQKVIRSVRVKKIIKNTVKSVQDLWEKEGRAYQPSDDISDEEWLSVYESLIQNYKKKEGIVIEDIPELLRKVDSLLKPLLNGHLISLSNRKLDASPFEINVETKIKLPDAAEEFVSELRETVIGAEKLLNIFGKIFKK